MNILDATPAVSTESSKPVNPLRLARPLEKSGGEGGRGGLKRTVLPFRAMPLPTVSPLCPPGRKLYRLIESYLSSYRDM